MIKINFQKIRIITLNRMSCKSYIMVYLSLRMHTEWIIFRTGKQTWYNYFKPPTSVKTLYLQEVFRTKVNKGDIRVNVLISEDYCSGGKAACIVWK